MPLFEVETDAHIIITWADDEEKATEVLQLTTDEGLRANAQQHLERLEQLKMAYA